MSDYMPTTEQVRDRWASLTDHGGLTSDERRALWNARCAEFYAWLNAKCAAVWDQGRLAAKWDTPNPYRVADQVRDDMKEGK